MHLVDVDAIGAQAPQRIVDLLHDPLPAGIAGDLAVMPFEPDLGGKDDVIAEAIGERLADDLLGPAEAVDWRGIDDIDAVGERGPDRGDRLRSSVPPHIQPPIAQVPSADARHAQHRAGDLGEFHHSVAASALPNLVCVAETE